MLIGSLMLFIWLSMLTSRLQCFVIGIHMSVDAVSDVLVLGRSENFVGSCLVSHLLEASGEHF